ncbi:Similar to Phf5a: PHD finger-like domain-containing protein 5A (Rattus norvegicus) [Cotesia congregata]|uniref:Similar to Phf5a: PHD finger-like domain-containing protein 5A (Rattus norvegicus) n=1 Tax=Cotesia congregata TaxID=51543 RepID=A0A8J2HA97_COTCN|nr:Similar to Phf5a: PHD finger-like domain-containing protein 5A (Rattus norvegicus) [Cotesia congregata]
MYKFFPSQRIFDFVLPSGFAMLFGRCSSKTKAIGRLCEKCDGKCVICDSYVRPCTLVRICDECNYGSYQGRCKPN